MLSRFFQVTLLLLIIFSAGAQNVSTLNFCETKASFNGPVGLYMDNENLLIVDQANHALRVLDSIGYVHTIAGNGSPDYVNVINMSSLAAPSHVTKDKEGNLYITTEFGSPRIRKIDKLGNISTFASQGMGTYTDGTGISNWFVRPKGIAYDSVNNFIYVADSWGHRVHRITMTGEVQTLAGSLRGFADGTGADAKFSYPEDIALDKEGNLYVTDSDNHKIRKITPAGVVSTYAGSTVGLENGNSITAKFNYPACLTFDKDENLFITDKFNRVIRKISKTGIVSTYSGSGEFGNKDDVSSLAQYKNLEDIVVDALGNVYVTDNTDHVIRMVTPYNYNEVVTLAGTGTGGFVNGCQLPPLIKQPLDVICDMSGNAFFTDFLNNRIMKVDENGKLSVLAGRKKAGMLNGSAEKALFNGPTHLSLDNNGNIYVSEQGNHSIRKINPSGDVTTVAGNGTYGFSNGNALASKFHLPRGMALDDDGNIWVGDANNFRIRYISNSGTVSTYAGSSMPGNQNGELNEATFLMIEDILLNEDGTFYLLSNNSIRKIQNNMVSAIAGNESFGFEDGEGEDARFKLPTGIVKDIHGNLLIADMGNNAIRLMSPNGMVTTLAGNGLEGFEDGNGSDARFYGPSGLSIHKDGYLLVTDNYNGAIRKIELEDIISSVASVDIINNPVQLYPNPSKGKFHIPETISLLKVNLFSSTGLTETFYSHDIETNLKGIVVVQIITKENSISQKVLIED